MTPTPPLPKRTKARGASCRIKCAGGNDCVCYGNVNHVIHACKDADCICREQMRGKVVRR